MSNGGSLSPIPFLKTFSTHYHMSVIDTGCLVPIQYDGRTG